MKKQKDAPAIKYPYARPKAMTKLMDVIQGDKWKPPEVDADLIKTLAVAPSKERETLQALKFIGVVDDAGATTSVWNELMQDYQHTLQRIVRQKYSSLFEQIPLTLITQDSVVNFFMKAGKDRDTAEYQGMLFGWFCRQAGIEVPNLPEKFKRARFAKKKLATKKKAAGDVKAN